MMKIAIDAGHGRYTSGKRCLKSIDKNETREWVLNSRIAEKVCKLLKQYDCETKRMDDTSGETDVSLSERCRRANSWQADFYLSIHHNAGGGSGRVKVAVDELNVRSGAGVSYDVLQKVGRNEVFTITEVKAGTWGKLKSGAGWINVGEKYCARV